MGTKAPVCSISFHFHLERPSFPQLQRIALHSTTQLLDSGAHSPHKAWPSRTRHLANPNQKLGFLLPTPPSYMEIVFSFLTGDHIRLEFYGTQLTISATRMVARRFSLLPSHASRVESTALLNRLRHHATMPSDDSRVPIALNGLFLSPNIDHEQ